VGCGEQGRTARGFKKTERKKVATGKKIDLGENIWGGAEKEEKGVFAKSWRSLLGVVAQEDEPLDGGKGNRPDAIFT